MNSALILGLSGLALTPEERAFFAELQPWGFILFKRNCESKEQVLRLTDELRALSGRSNVPILIDQEGGRVARLRPPVWRLPPPAWTFAEIYERDVETAEEAAALNSRLIAAELRVAFTRKKDPCSPFGISAPASQALRLTLHASNLNEEVGNNVELESAHCLSNFSAPPAPSSPPAATPS